jgi:hypothetical protein
MYYVLFLLSIKAVAVAAAVAVDSKSAKKVYRVINSRLFSM